MQLDETFKFEDDLELFTGLSGSVGCTSHANQAPTRWHSDSDRSAGRTDLALYRLNAKTVQVVDERFLLWQLCPTRRSCCAGVAGSSGPGWPRLWWSHRPNRGLLPSVLRESARPDRPSAPGCGRRSAALQPMADDPSSPQICGRIVDSLVECTRATLDGPTEASKCELSVRYKECLVRQGDRGRSERCHLSGSPQECVTSPSTKSTDVPPNIQIQASAARRGQG